jgi:hypothetical protein
VDGRVCDRITTNRPDVQFTTLTRENWAGDLAIHLSLVQEVLLHVPQHMKEKTVRLGKLLQAPATNVLKPANSSTRVNTQLRSRGISLARADRSDRCKSLLESASRSTGPTCESLVVSSHKSRYLLQMSLRVGKAETDRFIKGKLQLHVYDQPGTLSERSI